MRENFGGSLYKIEAMKVEVSFIEEAVNLLRIALPQVRGFSQRCLNHADCRWCHQHHVKKLKKASMP